VTARTAAAKSGLRGPAAAETTAAAGPRPSPWRGAKLRKKIELTILLTPALVLFAGFVLLPVVIAAYYSVFNWTGFGPLTDFIGMHNYKVAFDDPVFREAIEHNIIIAVLSLVIQLPLSLGIALLVNRRFRGRSFVRLVIFAPYVLPPAVTAVMWSLMLQPGGFVDQLMKSLGLGGLVQLWLANTRIVLYTNFVVLTWQYIGFGIVLLLAGLQAIPAELHEAAAIDGATAWQVTRRITLPLLGPTIRIWIFLSVIGSLQVFDVVWILTGGGPANASMTMSTYMILDGFRSLEFGYGTAIAVILFFFCLVFSLLYQRFALRRDMAGAMTRAVGG
jgi:raffinose/stachyose/melibiose transport system permease protein